MKRLFPILFLLLAGVASAQVRNDAWDNLAQFRAGEKIELMDSRMRTITGEFISYSPDRLTVRTNSAERDIVRTDVTRVAAFGRPTHRGRNALIGLAIGAGIAAGIGAAHPGGDLTRAETAAAMTTLGGAIGAVAGALTPSHARRVVYYSESK